MQDLLLLAVVVVVALIVVSVVGVSNAIAGRRDSPRLFASTRWHAAHVSDGRTTHIMVQRVGGGQVLEWRQVSSVPDDDEDYDARFLEAMALARSRAATLNAEDDTTD